MNWKQRLKKISSRTLSEVNEKQLIELMAEAEKSNSDLQFALQNYGAKFDSDLDFSVESLIIVEKNYRKVVSQKIEKIETEIIERLLTLYLGQTIFKNEQAEWAVYKGRYYTVSPFVIKFIKTNRFWDIFVFCQGLSEKKSLIGFRDQTSLIKVIENIDVVSFKG